MFNIVPATSGYQQEKSYKLAGDGYIQGRAKIACWQYGDDPPKVDVKVDILKAFHAKGRNLLSAYIIDIAKNGPGSYLQIDKPKLANDKYDYAGFSQEFTDKDFPAVNGAKACPIDSIGRIVVVVGTLPPSDSDTLSDGAVDIIAEAVLSTSSTAPEVKAGDGGVDTGMEEQKVETEEQVEEPEVKPYPYMISEPELADPFGKRIDRIVAGHPVLVETKLTNNLDEEQAFVYILQVKDYKGITVFLTWIKGTMRASTALDAGISWTPDDIGKYTIEVFVWKSLEDLGLPLTKTMIVSVRG
jgi:hypothetical protein